MNFCSVNAATQDRLELWCGQHIYITARRRTHEKVLEADWEEMRRLGKADLDVRAALWQAFLDRYFPISDAKTSPFRKQLQLLLAGVL